VLVRSIEHRACPLRGGRSADWAKPAKLTNGRPFCRAPHKRGSRTMAVQFWTFHFVKQLGQKALTHTKITVAACATRVNSILSSWCSGPSAPLSPCSAEGLALRRLFRFRKPWFWCFRLLEHDIRARVPALARPITRPGGCHGDEI